MSRFILEKHKPALKRIILNRIIEERPYQEIADKIIEDILGYKRGWELPVIEKRGRNHDV